MSSEPAPEELPQEDEGLVPNSVQDVEAGQTEPQRSIYQKTVADIAWFIKHPNFHKTIITLTLIDALCVFIDLAYTFLRECTAGERGERPVWVEAFSYLSIVIVSMFLAEIPVAVWVLGINYYNPFKHGSAGKMHFFDAVVIIATFVLEVVLRGKERELAGLLVILRLWRLFELAESIALSTSELHEHEQEQIREEMCRLTSEVEMLKTENRELRKRIGRRGSGSGPSASPERGELANDDPKQAGV